MISFIPFEIIEDTVLDTVKLIPFLYITYLAMEFLEHKAADKMQAMMKKGGKLGPIFGGILGVAPQCGFSAAAASLYTGRVITLGTLIAVFLSTSDEMLPIMLSNSNITLTDIGQILLLKMLIGITAGFLCDLFIYQNAKSDDEMTKIHDLCEHEHCHCTHSGNIIFSALIHTAKIIFFIFIVSFILNTILNIIGEEALSALLLNKPLISLLIAGLIGLIPNCASSVVLTQLFVEGAISFAACMTGLLAGTGVGILVLFRTNHPLKENIKITLLLYAIGIIAGLLIEILIM